MSKFSWIQEILHRQYPGVDWAQGLDLNESGAIETPEKLVDFNHDGFLGDSADWEHYYQDNSKILNHIVPFFRTASSVALSVDNPIHSVLAIESEIVSQEKVNKAYQAVVDILNRVRVILEDPQQSEKYRAKIHEEIKDRTKNPEAWKIVLIYKIIEEKGFKLKDQNNSLLVQNIKKQQLDCDTSSFVVQAVAYELGYPLSLVLAPKHAFLKWMGEGDSFYMDYSAGVQDRQYYFKRYRFIEALAPVANGTYLRALSSDEVAGMMLSNRALFKGEGKEKVGREEAIKDYTEAIDLFPSRLNAYYNRGLERSEGGDSKGAIEDFLQTLRLDPRDGDAYKQLGILYSADKKYVEAIVALDRAIENEVDDAKVYHERAFAKWQQGDNVGAIVDFTKAIDRDPENGPSWAYRGAVKVGEGDYNGAVKDYRMALLLDPKDQLVLEWMQELKSKDR